MNLNAWVSMKRGESRYQQRHCSYAIATYVVAPPDATVKATAHAATSTGSRALNGHAGHTLEVADAAESGTQRASGETPALNGARIGIVLVIASLADANVGLEVQTRPLVVGIVVGPTVEDLLDRTGEQVVGDMGLSLEGPSNLLDGVGLVDASNVGGDKCAVGGDDLGEKRC